MAFTPSGNEIALALSATEKFQNFETFPQSDGSYLYYTEDPAHPGDYLLRSFDATGAEIGQALPLADQVLTVLPGGQVLTASISGTPGDPVVITVIDRDVSDGVNNVTITYAAANPGAIARGISVVALSGAQAGQAAIEMTVQLTPTLGISTVTLFDLATGQALSKRQFTGFVDPGQSSSLVKLADGTLVQFSIDNGTYTGAPGTYFTVLQADGSVAGVVGSDGVIDPLKVIAARVPVAFNTVSGSPSDIQMVALAQGGFVMMWTEFSVNNGYLSLGALHAQIFDATGAATSDDIIVSQDGPAQTESTDVVALAGGGFAIAWASRNPGGSSSDTEISVRTFGADGHEIGQVQQVNTITTGTQIQPELAALPNGGFSVSWRDLGFGVAGAHAQSFADNTGLTIAGTDGNDRMVGTAKDDTFLASAGDDMFIGNGGNDTVSYADDASRIYVSLATTSPNNTLSSGIDRFYAISNVIGSAFDDTILGSKGDNVLDGGAGNDKLTGAAGNDRLIGGSGHDVLNGGTGADMMIGGSGNDRYFVDNVGDVVVELATADIQTGESSGIDTVSSSISYALGANVENLTLIGSDNISGSGNGLNNTIVGNIGDNVLSGGGGIDSLTGGIGRDTFVFATGANAAWRSIIRDFTPQVDKLAFEATAYFGFYGQDPGHLPSEQFGYGNHATTAEQRLIYDESNGNLYYDVDGTGAQAQIRVATLLGTPHLTASDIVLI